MKCFIIMHVTPGNDYSDTFEYFLAAYPTLDAAVDQAIATFGAVFDSFAGGLPYRAANELDDGGWIEIWRGTVKQQEIGFDQSYRGLHIEGERE